MSIATIDHDSLLNIWENLGCIDKASLCQSIPFPPCKNFDKECNLKFLKTSEGRGDFRMYTVHNCKEYQNFFNNLNFGARESVNVMFEFSAEVMYESARLAKSHLKPYEYKGTFTLLLNVKKASSTPYYWSKLLLEQHSDFCNLHTQKSREFFKNAYSPSKLPKGIEWMNFVKKATYYNFLAIEIKVK